MFRFISRHLLTGIITLLPITLTLYLIYWLAISAEKVLGGLLKLILPEHCYLPGVGVIAGLGVVFIVGILMHAYVFQSLFDKFENLLYRMPLIRPLYTALRDFFNYFTPKDKKEFEQVVSVTLGTDNLQVIGFVTQPLTHNLPEGFNTEGSVLVYIPMSYMIGGYTALIPRKNLQPLNMTMEEAMRFTLTAGVTGTSNRQTNNNETISD